MRKRSISLAGHKTSIALEEEFWNALEKIAAARHIPLAALIFEIDAARTAKMRAQANPPHNLASALRVFCLDHVRETLNR